MSTNMSLLLEIIQHKPEGKNKGKSQPRGTHGTALLSKCPSYWARHNIISTGNTERGGTEVPG